MLIRRPKSRSLSDFLVSRVRMSGKIEEWDFNTFEAPEAKSK
jgi:hypothetical protein